MSKTQLSKSTYIKGLQCTKALYLHKHHYTLKDKISVEQQAIFTRGNKVGKYAQKLFPKGTEIFVKKYNYNKAAEETMQLILNGCTTIYEAVFLYNDVIVIIDIINKTDDKWIAYEVKSSLKISTTYMQDAALQYYVIKNSLPTLADIQLVNLNAAYVLDTKIELNQLFSFTTVKAYALEQWEKIEENITTLKNVIKAPIIPEVAIGTHCFTPYNCDFRGNCWGALPNNNVFDLTDISNTRKFEWYNNGIILMQDLLKEEELSVSQQVQINASITNQVYCDSNLLKKFFSKIKYPLGFLDFEAIMPAIPIYKGNKPYQMIPFLYSLHSKESMLSKALHHSFIAEIGIKPEKFFIEKLLVDTKDLNSIVVYDTGLELSILNNCKQLFPNYGSEIDTLKDKFIDLKEIFDKRIFYHPASIGSTKLKVLANAMLKENNPYKLSNIQHGVEALSMYEDLQKEVDLFKIIEVKEILVSYCKADTEAVMGIYDLLWKQVQ